MDWQYKLIELYLYIAEHVDGELWVYTQRLSNNQLPHFSDEELLTIYLFGLMQRRLTIKDIYRYADQHLRDFFPRLPAYQTFVDRLNRLADLFPALIEIILQDADATGVVREVKLIDSFPVILAQQKRSTEAKVAREIANKGYCSSKNTYYHGVKVHLLGARKPGRLPLPEAVALSPGSANDLTVMRHYFPFLTNCQVFGDKIYAEAELKERLKREQGVELHTPTKRKKGQQRLPLDQRLYSTAVSRVRQPIESLFNWINEKTGIEVASKVRSTKGLLVHVFGRLAAAMFMLVFYS